MGVPLGLDDDDIHTNLPFEDADSDVAQAMKINVGIARITGNITKSTIIQHIDRTCH